jgi:[protein-PII] uridylyltransferase
MPSPGLQDSRRIASPAAAWRRSLAEARQRLAKEFATGASPGKFLLSHGRLVDNLLRDIWASSGLPPSVALVAVGGYGRGELFPNSDVDLLLLLDAELADADRQRLEQLVGLLWDVGLEVGHSVRTLEQCLDETAKDITVQTNLLEARLICGNETLFDALTAALATRFDKGAFFQAKLLEQQQRHARFHDTAYNLEPNLKESPGGLRDLHNILWIARGCGIGDTWQKLVRESIITAQEARQIRRHERFLEDLRIRLHYVARRREDRLLFDFQATLAQQFGLADKRPRRASELLMQRYYRTAKAISLLNVILLQNLRARIFTSADAEVVVINSRFTARKNLLEVADENLFQREPRAILESFLVLQQHPQLKGMGAGTLRALWRAKDKINAAFRAEPANRALFMEILRQPRGVTHELRRMHQYGVLERYIPAFGRIVGQMQHDLFHVYTVDEHILMVLRNLRRFTLAAFTHEYPLCSRLINEFERPEVLYLGALFHDIAKGRGGDHSKLGRADARRFCRLHGLDETDTAMVAWLVENHLTMSSTAQKRDLSDLDVITEFAALVGDQRHLTALYLLTVADIRGTSPKVWNAWKGKLLEELFLATRRALSGTAAMPDEHLQARQVEALRILRLYALGPTAHEALWSKLDTGYFLRHDAQEIAWQTRLLQTHVDSATPVVRARLSPIGEGMQVMIYTTDKNDLFARICSFFERINYNILEARIDTTRHGYALDSFLVLDPSGKNVHYRDLISYIEYELTQRLQREGLLEPPVDGRLSRHLKHFPIDPEVSLKPDERGTYYVLSVTAGDRPGLLSRIAQTLLRHGVQLHTAKINTLGERAEDIFLIRGDDLDDTKAVLRLETDLLRQLKTQ